MGGLEGLKILSQVIESHKAEKCFVICVLVLLILFCVLTMIAVIMKGDMSGIAILILVAILSVLMYEGCKMPNSSTIIKVTPIEDKYYIDLNKYDVVSTEGEIITLEVKEVE